MFCDPSEKKTRHEVSLTDTHASWMRCNLVLLKVLATMGVWAAMDAERVLKGLEVLDTSSRANRVSSEKLDSFIHGQRASVAWQKLFKHALRWAESGRALGCSKRPTRGAC